MYSFSNLDEVCCSMSGSKCCFLTCLQISQDVGKVVWYSHLRILNSIVMHTVKGISVVNEAEIDVFLEFSCFIYDLMVISGSSAFSKYNLSIWKFLFQVLLEDF